MISETFQLHGRGALVTGSSRGIGAAIAVALASAGADVVVNYRGNESAAKSVAKRLRAMGRTAGIVRGDIGEKGSAAQVLEKAVELVGKVDILVSNASIQIAEPWNEVTRDHFNQQSATNFQGAFELIQLAAPPMLDRGWGRILTIGSVQEAKPHPEMMVYSALKAAQTLMVKNFAKQFASRGVTVNNLAPGVISTDRSNERLVDPDYKNKVLSGIPAGRLGDPEDCAGAALLLCSEAGRYITGQNLFVDGGMSL